MKGLTILKLLSRNSENINKEMKSSALGEDIVNLTTKIYLEFPALYRNLNEMPLLLLGEKSKIEQLSQYFESLELQYQSFKNPNLEEKG